MMHPLAIYAVQVHLADLMAEAEANRLAKLGRKPRTAGLVASLVALRPQPVRFERRTQRRFARLIDRTPAGWPPPQPARFNPGLSSGPGAISSRTPAHPPRGGRLGVSGLLSAPAPLEVGRGVDVVEGPSVGVERPPGRRRDHRRRSTGRGARGARGDRRGGARPRRGRRSTGGRRAGARTEGRPRAWRRRRPDRRRRRPRGARAPRARGAACRRPRRPRPRRSPGRGRRGPTRPAASPASGPRWATASRITVTWCARAGGTGGDGGVRRDDDDDRVRDRARRPRARGRAGCGRRGSR